MTESPSLRSSISRIPKKISAQVIREAAEKTGDAVGDGTSTSTLLAHAIYSEGLKNIAAGASAVDLKRGLDRGLRVAVEKIKSMSRPVSSRKGRAGGDHFGTQRFRAG